MIHLDRLPTFVAGLASHPDPAIEATAEYLSGILVQVEVWNAGPWPPTVPITLDQTRNAEFYAQSQNYPDPSIQVLLSWALTVLNQVGDMNRSIREGSRPPGGAAQGFWG